MKKLGIVFCIAGLVSLHAADDAPPKPGFLRRAWEKTKGGASAMWDTTKSVGTKTAQAVKSPFSRKGADEIPAVTAWRNLAVSMKLEPAQVRLPETHVIDVTMSVVNKGKQAVQLEFPSSVRIEVVVKADGGKIVSRWSDDQRVEKEPGILLINPSERLEYSAKISTREMSAGRQFEIEAYFPSYERLRTSRMVVPEK
jgi:hypothetical protein